MVGHQNGSLTVGQKQCRADLLLQYAVLNRMIDAECSNYVRIA
jgi:hypothetical protein